ncbi:hypothetical protein QNH48_28295 [Neobacillus sp. YX16]|uniref:hypothetical protein n=1 Tax=Neobacillus sp. YX16 TaxID=3047874 RepID=UPI0024C2BCFF|nr:hypothetical protein [Neobacillus sp. YX16]WHZ02776.1 hypothetical protein QNH48_28295 [Neobacillus sp. YX16]
MKKNILIAVLCLGVIVVIYFFASTPTSPIIPTTSLEKSICERISAQFGDCKQILLYDSKSNLVFAENSSGIIPVLTNKGFTDFKKFIYPEMDFQSSARRKWREDQLTGERIIRYQRIFPLSTDLPKTMQRPLL